MSNKKKCGIVTFHSSHNYGSVLQAYALEKTISNLGYPAEIIDFRHPTTTKIYKRCLWSNKNSLRSNIFQFLSIGIFKDGKAYEEGFNNFIEKQLVKSKQIKNLSDIPTDYDILICGSDQIWNPISSGENHPIYFLNFPGEAKRFSYAASSGSRPFIDNENFDIAKILGKYESIGVREEFMQQYLKNEIGLESIVNPDPTLLLTKSDWEKLEKPYHGLPKEYILVYSIIDQKGACQIAQQVAKDLHLPIVHIATNETCNFLSHNEFRKIVDYSLTDVTPEQFVWLFHNARHVVSSSFHGNMFSLIFEKDFTYHFRNVVDSRILTIHERAGLGKSRWVKNCDNIKITQKIDYSRIRPLLEKYRADGIHYILSNIEK